MREAWDRPLIVKGLLSPEDAAHAVDLGADAVVVSNHGGRLLDGAPATITVLEEVVQAVAGRADVLIDGGIRRGTDIARRWHSACLVGRP